MLYFYNPWIPCWFWTTWPRCPDSFKEMWCKISRYLFLSALLETCPLVCIASSHSTYRNVTFFKAKIHLMPIIPLVLFTEHGCLCVGSVIKYSLSEGQVHTASSLFASISLKPVCVPVAFHWWICKGKEHAYLPESSIVPLWRSDLLGFYKAMWSMTWCCSWSQHALPPILKCYYFYNTLVALIDQAAGDDRLQPKSLAPFTQCKIKEVSVWIIPHLKCLKVLMIFFKPERTQWWNIREITFWKFSDTCH